MTQYLPAALMIASAILHAAIGVRLKQAQDKLVFRAILSLTSAVIVFPLAFIVPLPPPQAVPFLAAGALIHFLYQITQIKAFQRGDMSLVYPIMRGTAPALAAGFAFLILGETITVLQGLGLGLAVLALISFGLPEKSRPKNWGPAAGFALLCGVMVALYSVIDGGGMRVTREAMGQVWSYMVWFFLIDGVMVIALALFRRRGDFSVFRAEAKWAMICGIGSLLTFGFALFAFSLAPIGPLSALRETSVVFGAAFAAYFLREPFGLRRITLAGILAVGLILTQFG